MRALITSNIRHFQAVTEALNYCRSGNKSETQFVAKLQNLSLKSGTGKPDFLHLSNLEGIR